MQAFLRRNREFRSDPELLFEHERLQRDVMMRQTVFTTLSQSLEQARIEAARNTPSIRIIERGETPLVPDRRRLLTKTVLAMVVGAGVAFLVAFFREASRREGTTPDERFEFQAALAGAMPPWLRRGRKAG